MPLLGIRYDPVTDSAAAELKRRGLHRDEDFEYGISFTAKYIGTEDVTQPHNRVEIVASMRRIRFECKTRGIKKQKVDITVSVKGVKVIIYRRNKKKALAEGNLPLLEHPIYRIFYVSHDSHDLLIFSYISREASTNHFRCNVFKAFKKSHAVQVVRTIGQAFDVCHRLATEAELDDERNDKAIDNGTDELAPNPNSCKLDMPSTCTTDQKSLDQSQTIINQSHSTVSDDVIRRAQQVLALANFKPTLSAASTIKAVGTITSPMAPLQLTDEIGMGEGLLNSYQQMQMLLQQQREFQAQQMQCLLSQMQLIKDQLAAETEARIEAQAQVHQLLMQNQELLEQVNLLVQRLIQLEIPDSLKAPTELLSLPQIPFSSETMMMTRPHPIHATLPRSIPSHVSDVIISAQNISPDSGHRDMSSDSLSVGESATLPQSLTWFTTPPHPTRNTLPSVDSRRSLVTFSGGKSVSISKADDHVAKNLHNTNYSDELPVIIGERLKPEGLQGSSPGQCVVPFDPAPKPSLFSMQTECNCDNHVTREILFSSGHCNLSPQVTSPLNCATNSMLMKNATFVCGYQRECLPLPGSDFIKVVEPNGFTDVATSNFAATEVPGIGANCNHLSAVSLHSQNSFRGTQSSQVNYNSLPG